MGTICLYETRVNASSLLQVSHRIFPRSKSANAAGTSGEAQVKRQSAEGTFNCAPPAYISFQWQKP